MGVKLMLIDDDHDLMYVLVVARAYKLLMNGTIYDEVVCTNPSCDGELAVLGRHPLLLPC
jgi:hypothetical protein